MGREQSDPVKLRVFLHRPTMSIAGRVLLDEGRFRPHRCDFHDRRSSYYVHAEIQATGDLHWRYWNARRALAHGKIGISTYGVAPVRVNLSRPRIHCGQRVFTKGRFKVRIRLNGGHKTYRYSVPLDICPL